MIDVEERPAVSYRAQSTPYLTANKEGKARLRKAFPQLNSTFTFLDKKRGFGYSVPASIYYSFYLAIHAGVNLKGLVEMWGLLFPKAKAEFSRLSGEKWEKAKMAATIKRIEDAIKKDGNATGYAKGSYDQDELSSLWGTSASKGMSVQEYVG